MLIHFFKSLLHNFGVILVGFVVALIGVILDSLFQISAIQTPLIFGIGLILIAIGFSIRVWATYYFYSHQMKVISLKPQKKLFTSGPYRFSRNPLYLGGNIFIFFGASFVFGSPSACIITILGIFVTDHMIQREEKQLEKTFKNDWNKYKKRVRRWI